MTYEQAKAEAQQKADDMGFDYGVEKNAFGYSAFMLPERQNRYGHELRCEVVSATDARKQRRGHGSTPPSTAR